MIIANIEYLTSSLCSFVATSYDISLCFILVYLITPQFNATFPIFDPITSYILRTTIYIIDEITRLLGVQSMGSLET